MLYSGFISLLLASLALAAPTPTRQSRRAPLKRASQIIGAVPASPLGYIVSLKPNTVDPTARGEWLTNVLSTGGIQTDSLDLESMKLTWSETVFNGFSGDFSEEALEVLRAQDEVNWVQTDILMYTTALVQQTNSPWGVSRLSTGTTPLPSGSDPLALSFFYSFDDTAGANTDIFIIDTGVRTTHLDFGGRASFLATFGNGVPGQDINGHGSHCAGIAAGSVFGMAKQANIVAVKVMEDDGSGATSNIIAGINAAIQTAVQSGRSSIISMSLGGPANQAIDDAVSNGIGLGVPFVVAAGNDGVDASTSSPARLGGPGGSGVITVGATTITDEMASFSNFGANVDILGPGQDILSCGAASDDAIANLSGTSMSTPHIAGLAAVIMGQEGKLDPAGLKSRLTGLGVQSLVTGVPANTQNLLAFNGANL